MHVSLGRGWEVVLGARGRWADFMGVGMGDWGWGLRGGLGVRDVGGQSMWWYSWTRRVQSMRRWPPPPEAEMHDRDGGGAKGNKAKLARGPAGLAWGLACRGGLPLRPWAGW